MYIYLYNLYNLHIYSYVLCAQHSSEALWSIQKGIRKIILPSKTYNIIVS